MEDTQIKIQKLKEEIKELEEKREIKKLEDYKRSLSHDLDDIVEGECPSCGISLKFDSKDRKEKRTVCPKCNHEFNLSSAKQKITYRDIKRIKEANCPNCSTRLIFPKNFDPWGKIRCAHCHEYFKPQYSYNRSYYTTSNKNLGVNRDNEFSNILGSYKLTVLLSIFFDLLLIPTLYGLSQRSKLNSMKHNVNPSLNSSFSSWDSVFIIFLLLKILLFCFGFYLGITEDSTY